jgi:hypothetical protein
MGVGGQPHNPAALPPGPLWTGAENLGPSGFDPRTAQPVRVAIPIALSRSLALSINILNLSHTPIRGVTHSLGSPCEAEETGEHLLCFLCETN